MTMTASTIRAVWDFLFGKEGEEDDEELHSPDGADEWNKEEEEHD